AAALVVDLAARQLERHVRVVEVVVGEVLLDHPAPVAEAEHEVAEAVPAVQLHDVPEERAAADVDERLRPELGLFAHARALAAAQQHDLRPRGCGGDDHGPVIARMRRELRPGRLAYRRTYPVASAGERVTRLTAFA